MGSLVLALTVAWRVAPGEQPDPPEGLRITVLDVGQGDAILLEVAEGAVLVDQGPPEAGVADQLDELGVDELTALVLTHPQRDHIGGAAEVLEQLDVGAVLDPLIPAASEDHEAAIAAARERDVPVVVGPRGPELPGRRPAGADPLARWLCNAG